MLEQVQTTIRVLIVAAAGVAVIAMARPEPASQVRASVPLAAALRSTGEEHAERAHTERIAPLRLEESTGFAVFCEDRR